MRAFVLAVVAMAVISVGAWYGLGALGWSSENVYQKRENVRLG